MARLSAITAALGPPLLIVSLVGSQLAACSKADPSSAAPSKTSSPDSSGPPAALVDAWRKATLTVSAFTADKSGAVGASCHSGTVSGVDVLVCAFASDKDAKAAEPKALEWVGSATGTALSSGKLVLAAVDRRAADPSGRTINAIAKAFR
jgi:hypothetical protein